jgi:hypothetical protein
MSFADAACLTIAVALALWLVYALVRGEEL